MKNTGLAKIEQPEFLELIKNSGLELTKAETYALGYAPLMMKVREQTDIIKGLDKTIPEHSELAKKASVQLGHICSELEDKKDEDKKYIRIEDKLIQGLFNIAESTARLGQKDAREIFTYQEKLQKEAEEKQYSERIELLAPYEIDTEFLSLDKMPEDQFQKLLAKEKESFELITAKRKKDEADRIEAERLAEVARVEAEKAEAERIRLQAIENERLKKQNDRQNKMFSLGLKWNGEEFQYKDINFHWTDLLAMSDKDFDKAYSGAEKRMIVLKEAEAKELELQQKEATEKQAELDSVKSELQKKQEQEEAEKQQAIAEQNERDAAAKALLLAPDQDKVKAFYNQFIALQFPELESEQGKAMTVRVNEALAIVKQVIIQDSKTLL